ncbi:MAG: hypothetical protein Q4B70_04610 [Lachnospiraceae bacterium]|nr:hypothetical protein [Lachnospiraceae bacterium]
MDKGFMSEYYRCRYEDPIGEILGDDQIYRGFYERVRRLSEVLYQGTDQQKALEELLGNAMANLELRIAEQMYLQGAQDRDNMLR